MSKQMKKYCGIGSRQSPAKVLNQMEEFAYLAARKMILRSGAAPGADSAFMKGCKNATGTMEIFLPWKGFNKSDSPLYEQSKRAFEIAAEIHPHFVYAKHSIKCLIARNMQQVLGEHLDDPVEFVVCWTGDGCENMESYKPSKTGGTGSAIALAYEMKIPVYNLFYEDRLLDAYEHLFQIEVT